MSKADSFSREEKRRKKGRGKRAEQGRDGKGREKKKVKMSLSDSFSIKSCSFSSAHSVWQPPLMISLTQQELIKRSAEQEWAY